MTRIHAVAKKSWHFPVQRHDSLYEKNGGWVIDPDTVVPGLDIHEDNNGISINIHIPGVTADKVDIKTNRPCLKQSKRIPYSREEIIHIVIPKKS